MNNRCALLLISFLIGVSVVQSNAQSTLNTHVVISAPYQGYVAEKKSKLTPAVISLNSKTIAYQSPGGQINICDTKLNVTKTIAVGNTTITSMLFAKNGMHIIYYADDKRLHIVDLETCRQLYESHEMRSTIVGIASTSSGHHIVALLEDGSIDIVDPSNLTTLETISTNLKDIHQVVGGPNERYGVVGRSECKVYEIRDHTVLLYTYRFKGNFALLSPALKTVACDVGALGNRCAIWDIATNGKLCEVPGQIKSFNCDGTSFITGGLWGLRKQLPGIPKDVNYESPLCFWKLSGLQIGSINVPNAKHITLSPDNTFALVSGQSKLVRSLAFIMSN